MIDNRPWAERNHDFNRSKQLIIDEVEELLAVNQLEYHNKNWLAGDTKSRREKLMEALRDLKGMVERLKW